MGSFGRHHAPPSFGRSLQGCGACLSPLAPEQPVAGDKPLGVAKSTGQLSADLCQSMLSAWGCQVRPFEIANLSRPKRAGH